MKMMTTIMAALFLLIISFSFLIIFIFYTNSGLELMVRAIPFISDNKIKIGEGSGILAKQFELKNMSYKNNNDQIVLDKINLTWQFPALFKRELIIQNLNITGLAIQLKEQAKTQTQPFELPRWAPHHYVINNATISAIKYNDINLPQSQWNGEVLIDKNNIKLQKLEGDLSDGPNSAHVDLKYINTLQGQWAVQINNFNHYLPKSSGALSSTGHLTDQNINIFINLQNFHYDDKWVKQFKLNLNGRLNGQQLQLSLLPNDFLLQSKTVGNWQLKKTATLNISQDSATISNLSLQSDKGYFTVSGNWQKDKDWMLNEIGKFPLKDYSITPEFNLTEKGDTQKITYAGTVKSGKGAINVHGQTKDTVTQLTIKGNNFLAVNTDDYHVWVTPDFVLQNSHQNWNLSGKLFIPKAMINLPDFGNQVITLPNDVVFTDRKNNSSSFPLYSNVQLTLGNNISISAQGLTGKIGGKLQLHDNPQQFTTGNGRLNITDGQYKVYGQVLKIKYGDLIFNNSPITNPGLHVRATKKIKVSNTSGAGLAALNVNNLSGALTVGVDVVGTLEEPQMTLFSEPATLSQMDILSYLVLGHPAYDASPLDARLLLQATTSMNMGGDQVEQLMRELQNVFGFDKLSVESINYVDPTAKTPSLSQTTALVLGKALSPRLYVSYSAGLLASVNIFTIKYTISKKWLLQSTASNFGSGVDIFRVW